MQEVSKALDWELNFSEIARVWTNGCIIRSSLMEELATLFKNSPSIIEDRAMMGKIKEWKPDLAYMVGLGLQHDFPLPSMSAGLNYLLGRITENSSANLIQAQRDYFGAHTYIRKDDPQELPVHTDWLSLKNKSRTI